MQALCDYVKTSGELSDDQRSELLSTINRTLGATFNLKKSFYAERLSNKLAEKYNGESDKLTLFLTDVKKLLSKDAKDPKGHPFKNYVIEKDKNPLHEWIRKLPAAFLRPYLPRWAQSYIEHDKLNPKNPFFAEYAKLYPEKVEEILGASPCYSPEEPTSLRLSTATLPQYPKVTVPMAVEKIFDQYSDVTRVITELMNTEERLPQSKQKKISYKRTAEEKDAQTKVTLNTFCGRELREGFQGRCWYEYHRPNNYEKLKQSINALAQIPAKEPDPFEDSTINSDNLDAAVRVALLAAIDKLYDTIGHIQPMKRYQTTATFMVSNYHDRVR